MKTTSKLYMDSVGMDGTECSFLGVDTVVCETDAPRRDTQYICSCMVTRRQLGKEEN